MYRIPRIHPRIFVAFPCLAASVRQAISAGLGGLVVLALAGCAHEPPGPGRAFTPEWTREIGTAPLENEVEDEDGENGESNVLIGDEEGPRVEIEDGRPRLRTGEEGGLEAGVQSGTGRVGYRWEW